MLSPRSINHESGSAAYVTPSLQLGTKVDNGEVRLSEYPHIFIIGDAADAFGALKSGSAAWSQVSRSLYASDSTVAYAPSLGGARCQEYCSIDRRTRLTVRGVYSTSCGDQGLVRPGESLPYRCLFCLNADLFRNSQKYAAYQTRKQTFEKMENCSETLGIDNMWKRRGLSLDDMTI